MDDSMQILSAESFQLLEEEKSKSRLDESSKDYSYIVFPLAKAYEGFLKKLFLDMDLITSQQYLGEHFRIGKALNPNLPKRYRSGWVWGKLSESCKGEELPMRMWETWKRARNRTFHFFPDKQKLITFEEARGLVEELKSTMEQALNGCEIH